MKLFRGLFTSEFWGCAGVALVSVLQGFPYGAAIVGAGYAISRGIVKAVEAARR